MLWDPVTDGRKYVDELRSAHEALERTHGDPGRDGGSEGYGHTEFLGFAFSEKLLSELKEIDTFSLLNRPAESVLVIDSGAEPDRQNFAGRLQDTGANGAYRHMPTPKLRSNDLNAALVPNEILQTVVRWVSEEQI